MYLFYIDIYLKIINIIMKFVRLFNQHTDYETYINGSGKVLPNISYCKDQNDLHFNPYTLPQPIAPVGKVQVFANPQCTEYADGQSREVWVRLNQAFGYEEGVEWGNMGESAHSCVIITPFPPDETPTSGPYSIILWTDYSAQDRDDTIPFESGEIVYCRDDNGGENWEPWLQNPQVIFE